MKLLLDFMLQNYSKLIFRTAVSNLNMAIRKSIGDFTLDGISYIFPKCHHFGYIPRRNVHELDIIL